MAGSKKKSTKHIEQDQKKISETTSKKLDLTDAFIKNLKGAFDEFNDISADKRAELYGDKEYLDQFWEYFKHEHPNILHKIDKEDLPVYFHILEKRWFTIKRLTSETTKFHNEFSDKYTETQVMEESLSSLKDFCQNKQNNIPANTFKDFADFAWFDHASCTLSPDGRLRTVDGLLILWNEFLQKNNISLSSTMLDMSERILTPDYNPTERVMITVAITKLRKELKWPLKTAFDKDFPLPIDVFSPYQNLLDFKNQWLFFLETHASQIDQSLAKKLDSVTVTNGDIKKQLLVSSRTFDDTKWFSEWEQYFRRIFNKLATYQLFDEVQKTKSTIDHYIDAMSDTFKKFPPYVDEIFALYPFNVNNISIVDPTLETDLEAIGFKIIELDKQYDVLTTEDEKAKIRQQIRDLETKQEERKWQAYIAFLECKEPSLWEVFRSLIQSKFNFSLLSKDQQQLLIDTLVKHKLQDTIQNKIPDLLDVDKKSLSDFVQKLFDMDNMDITIPTRYGPVPLHFLKKEFMASTRKDLPAINDLDADDLKHLPLNFLTQITESNAPFFEESVIFDSLYTDFSARNGKFRINDAYKVKITKDGKTVEGYLSPYCPIDEYNTEDLTWKALYLYSDPITSPNDERTMVRRPGDNDKKWLPVVIKNEDQAVCDMEILDKTINLNGEAFWALLFGYVLGQQVMSDSISPEQEKAFAEKMGELDVYRQKNEDEEQQTQETSQEKPQEKTVEQTERQKFNDTRKKLSGYWFPEEKYKENCWFVEGSKLFILSGDSSVPPTEYGKSRLQIEISRIDEKKWTFTIKFYGSELSLGKHEGATKELPIRSYSLEWLEKHFGKPYKLPSASWSSFDHQLDILTNSWISWLDKSFWSLKFDWSKFTYNLGEHSWKHITHFGIYQPKAIGENVDQESWSLVLYKIHCNANGTITISGDKNDYNIAKNFPSRTMDYATFMLFVKEKKLQPKCEDQIKNIYESKQAQDEETPTTVRGFSINNVFSFFKNSVSKLKDGIKKFDEERSEDLTDLLTSKWQLWNNIWWFFSPFARISSSFEQMGMDYLQERDNRVWKKIEKRVKYYEDFDYTKIYFTFIKPMLDGEIEVVPHYKIAALLLVNIKKAKGPYGKHPAFTNDGRRVGKLLGKDHQQRYLAMREKRIRDLEENAHVYGGPWADQIKNELVELEMRYIVHVMDGRHMWMGDDVKYYFQDKYSKKFCDELEWAYTWFYKQDGVEEWFTKNKDANFEFARVEYFRQLADRPQQALPYLKVMATKAINDTQWQVFDMAVLAGLLSGVFLNMTFSSTQSFIQKICRARGFVPWIFAKDIKHQTKIQRLLDLFSGGSFTSFTWYSSSNFSYRTNIWASWFLTKFATDDKKKSWISQDITIGGSSQTIMSALSKFLSLTGKNHEGKTLVDLQSDPKLSLSDKLLIKEFLDKSNEKDEDYDRDVAANTSSLTWSILTKSQSVVEKMTSLKKEWFNGSNGDEIQNMKAFSNNMKDAIPSTKESPANVQFFLEKFFNRFGDRWFAGDGKTKLIQRLKRCKTHPWSDADDILEYSVVGEILNVLCNHDTNVPDELLGALRAWKKFFANNLDTILHSSIVSSAFGPQYVGELDKPLLLLEPRNTAAMLLDAEAKYFYNQTLDKTGKQMMNDKYRTLKNSKKYLNASLYTLADQVEKKCIWFSNRFKKDPEEIKKTAMKSSATSAKATGAKIKNTDVTNEVRNILEGTPVEEEPDIYDDIPPFGF